MKVGTVKIDSPLIMAPLAGITNLPFRIIVKEAGCGLVYSEMISSYALVYKSKKTFEMLTSCKAEKPLSVQIFGADPFIMARAASIVEASGADIIDINFGCSVKKILKSGSGAALMKQTDKARAVMAAVKNAVSIPVTIKIRSGWTRDGYQAKEIAKIAQDCGISAIAIHPRTVSQGFKGFADWNIITAVRKSVSIPIIGNGDIITYKDALDMIKITKADFIMIGRAAIGNPLIFTAINSALKKEEVEPVNIDKHFDIMIKYFTESVKYLGETKASRMMRSRLCKFVKGMPYGADFKERVKHIVSEKEGIEIVEAYRKILKKYNKENSNNFNIDKIEALL
ncbi:MAG: tRNA dihydrouridine synthase DusB [Deltaproteobacteria bacterium]|nr:tRNA dihydrouridine synthase DusB [Deltaproteobacteria bacterium]